VLSPRPLLPFPTRRSSDLTTFHFDRDNFVIKFTCLNSCFCPLVTFCSKLILGCTRYIITISYFFGSMPHRHIIFRCFYYEFGIRSEEHTSELQSRFELVCR